MPNRRTFDASQNEPNGPDRRKSADGRDFLKREASGLERRRGPGRRLSDFLRAAEEGELSPEQFMFVSAVYTFKKANDVREAAKIVPADQLLVETDCPYMAPVPVRGKRCEPAFVVHTAKALAALRGVAEQTLFEQTAANAARLFGFTL